MSKSLLDQLDVYGTDFETAVPPTELDDVMTGSREVGLAPRTPSHQYPKLRRAIAAVGAMIVVVGGVAWLLNGNPEQDVVQTTVTTRIPQELSITWNEAQWTGDEQAPWDSYSAAMGTDRRNFAQVGDTILMFDHTHATCCDNPIPGTSLWPLLASNDDGASWTEISSLPGEDVHSLEIEAGDFFWVYGPQVGGGGGGIEITSTHTTIWVSADGLNWQSLDVEFVIAPPTHIGPGSPATRFVRASGDNIFIISVDTFEGDGGYWVGTVDTL